MTAFVKTRKGNFPDVNFYLAWKGFVEIGYDVIKFEEEEIDNLDIRADTPVFAGTSTTRTIINKVFGFDYTGINPYPEELGSLMGRGVISGIWGDVKEDVIANKKFVKPVAQKQFIGNTMDSVMDTIKMASIQDDMEVYVCDPVKFLSEFRVYVDDGEILNVKQYHGDWEKIPCSSTISKMVKAYTTAPIAYGLDVGVIENGSTVLVEVNDGICLGNYGLDTMNYAEMIASRWMQLTQN
jgi:hypothetical protein